MKAQTKYLLYLLVLASIFNPSWVMATETENLDYKILPASGHVVVDGKGDAPLATPPVWAEKGVYIYRVSTPDDPTALTHLEQGIAMVSNLMDSSVPDEFYGHLPYAPPVLYLDVLNLSGGNLKGNKKI